MWKTWTDASFNEGFSNAILACPKCSNGYLHQGNTTIYQRNEDEPWTTVIAQDDKEVTVTNFPSADTHNPSDRRQGLIIEFWCEMGCCDTDNLKTSIPLRLAIYQHKGNTFMQWVE